MATCYVIYRRLLISSRSSQPVFSRLCSTSKEPESRLAHIERQFDSVPQELKNKQAFHAAIVLFKERRSRAHVEFIHSALKYAKEYGIHKDLDTYKALLNVFPKGKMIPQNTFQRIMLHYPQQQNCCVKVLDEMEWQGVQPDKEIHDIVVNAFGEWNFATKKIKRMMYWMPKLKYSNKYIDRRKIEGKELTAAELAGHALRMMARDPATTLDYIKLGEAPSTSSGDSHLEDDWIVSAQSVAQRRIIAQLKDGEEVYVDGPFRVYLMQHPIQYITMTAKALAEPFVEFEKNEMIGREDYTDWFGEWRTERGKKTRNVHQQRDETILAMAVCSTTTNDSARKWAEHLGVASTSLSRMLLRLRLDRGDSLFDTVKEPIHPDEAEQAKTAS